MMQSVNEVVTHADVYVDQKGLQEAQAHHRYLRVYWIGAEVYDCFGRMFACVSASLIARTRTLSLLYI